MNDYELQDNKVEQIIKEYNKQIKSISMKAARIFKILIAFYLAIMVSLTLIFPAILKGGSGTIFYSIFGGIVGIVLFIGLLISLFVTSEKPFHNFIMKEMVDQINHTKGSNLEYTSYPKKQNFVNKTGGLFTRGASMDVKNRIEGQTDDFNKFSWYNMRLYTSDGKNQLTIFNGMYFVVEYPVGRIFQIRTHSKPKLKGTKFKRIDEENPLRIYVDEGDFTSYVDDHFIRLVSDMKTKLKAKKVFLAAVNNQIHFAYEGIKNFKKPKKMSKNTLNETFHNINSVISIANEIVKH